MQANEPRKQKTVTKAQLLSACDRRTRSSHSDQPQVYQLAPVIALGSLQIGTLLISASMVLTRGVTACRNMANMRCCLAVMRRCPWTTPHLGAVDAEIKAPSVENAELKGSFKAWSRSADSYTCYAYCQGFLPC